jgi:hypothetical protein
VKFGRGRTSLLALEKNSLPRRSKQQILQRTVYESGLFTASSLYILQQCAALAWWNHNNLLSHNASSLVASLFCQTEPSLLLQATLTACGATDGHDTEIWSRCGRRGSTPLWSDGEALTKNFSTLDTSHHPMYWTAADGHQATTNDHPP